MSAVAHAKPGLTQRRPLIGLSSPAQAFLLATMTVAGAAAILTSLLAPGRVDWPQLAVILAAGAGAHAFAVKTPGNQVFHSGLAFAVAAAGTLPPPRIVLRPSPHPR